MHPARRRRLAMVLLLVSGVGVAAALTLMALRENLYHFYDPTMVQAGEAPLDASFRIGGLVRAGSVQRTPGSLRVEFVVEDCENGIPVVTNTMLPDLFREGQGVSILGRLDEDGVFQAQRVEAKHDENYMPPEVAEALKNSGGVSCMPSRMLDS